MTLNGEAEDFINLFLAAECLSEVRNRLVLIATATKLLDHLRRLLKYGGGGEYPTKEASKIGDLAVSAIATTWKENSDTRTILKACIQPDNYWTVRRAAVNKLARDWKDDPDTLPTLKTCAQSDTHMNVRQAAVQKLAKGWKDESGMFELLYERALNDPFERKENWETNPRQIALEAIIKQRPDSPQTLSLLRDRAKNDPDEKLREFAKKKLEHLERQN